MMEELIQAVKKLADEEYIRAAAEHGAAAHSPHEGYALIKEEVEEAEAEVRTLSEQLGNLWTTVRFDEEQYGPHYLNQMGRTAIMGACELIQVAAMTEKARMGYEKSKEEHDNEKAAENDG